MGKTLVGAVAALTIGILVLSNGDAQAGAVPKCAWGVESSASTANLAFPDTDATYWVTPFEYNPDTQITVDGQYPTARFFSLDVYNSAGGNFSVNGVQSALIDYQINADPGSTNPYQQQAVTAGSYSVQVQSTVGSSNQIPIAPTGTAAGATGFLIFRVYLPQDGNFSAVALPKLTVTTGGQSFPLNTCPKPQQSGTVPGITGQVNSASAVSATVDSPFPPPCQGSACPPYAKFWRPPASATNSLFPNAANAYIGAIFKPDKRRVVVVRGKAPTSPSRTGSGTSPVPWPSNQYQLRYWSICNNLYSGKYPVIVNKLPSGKIDPGCRADLNTKVTRGEYTYVVAAESQRNLVSRKRGVTFVPMSLTRPKDREILIMRNMLPNNFANAVQNVAQNEQPASAAAVMKKYYPRTATCSLNTYLRGGPDACLRRAG